MSEKLVFDFSSKGTLPWLIDWLMPQN